MEDFNIIGKSKNIRELSSLTFSVKVIEIIPLDGKSMSIKEYKTNFKNKREIYATKVI